MAQELFKTPESLHRDTMLELRQRGLSIWRNCATSYRELPGKYLSLLEEKKAKGIKPLGKLRSEVLKEYPKIPFLDLQTEAEAMAMLQEWERKGSLAKRLEAVEDALKMDNSINTIKSWIQDYLYTASKLERENRRKQAMAEAKRTKRSTGVWEQ